MTNQEIVDYVMKTPGNTNPMILNQMIKNSGAKKLSDLENDIFYTIRDWVILENFEYKNVRDEQCFEVPLTLEAGQTYLVKLDSDNIRFITCLGGKEDPYLSIDLETDWFSIG
jgi:hypothetical protein